MTDKGSLDAPGLRAQAAAAAVLGVPSAAQHLRHLASRPGREVFVVDAPGRRLVAKCYPDRVRAQRGGERLAALSGEHGPLLVPDCLRIDLDARVVVMSLLHGTLLDATFDGPEAGAAAAHVGRAVAALHAIPAVLSTELRRAEMIGLAGSLVLDGEDAARAEITLTRAITLLDASDESTLVSSHGDLGPAQILDCGQHIGIVDFDKAVMAEPALDLGNLLAQLARKRGPEGGRLFGTLFDAYRSVETGGPRAAPVLGGGAKPSRSEVLGYALLVLLRKLAWLPAEERPQVRAAFETLNAWYRGGDSNSHALSGSRF